MSLHFVTLGVSTRCPACHSQLPIDGPLRSFHCRRCNHEVHVEPSTWAYVLRCAYEGIVRTTSVQSFTFSYPVGGLPCPACGSKIEQGELPTAFDGDIECPHCTAPFGVFPPPTWLTAELPQLLQIYAAAREVDSQAPSSVAQPRDTDIVPVALTCPNCEGVFTVPPYAERNVHCDQCHVELLIPEQEWIRIRPLGKIRLWAFCLDADMGTKTGDDELATRHLHGSVSSEQPIADGAHEVAGLFGDSFEGDVDALLATPSDDRRADPSPLATRTSQPPPLHIKRRHSRPGRPRLTPWMWLGLGMLAGAAAALTALWFHFNQ